MLCRPIAEGLSYAAFNNATGSYVMPQASFVGNDPQIAGSCKAQSKTTSLKTSDCISQSLGQRTFRFARLLFALGCHESLQTHCVLCVCTHCVLRVATVCCKSATSTLHIRNGQSSCDHRTVSCTRLSIHIDRVVWPAAHVAVLSPPGLLSCRMLAADNCYN